MPRLLAPLAALGFAAGMLLVGPLGNTRAADLDCPGFRTQEEAQAYFERIVGSPAYNADLLDRDRDGIARELNPSGGVESRSDADPVRFDPSARAPSGHQPTGGRPGHCLRHR